MLHRGLIFLAVLVVTGCGDDDSTGQNNNGQTDSGVTPDASLYDAGRLDGATGDAGNPADGATVDAGPQHHPLDDLDNVTVYLNLGDSMGAGYNADSGRGYAPLVNQNHSAYPAYAPHNIQALYPGANFVNRADSGATSNDVLGQTSSLPPSGSGDAVVTIHVGGNDFNDDYQTMVVQSLTQAAINTWVSNMTTVMSRLRTAYEDSGSGKVLVVLMANLHDPTGGTGDVPTQYTDDFCGTIRNFPAGLRATVMANHALFNTAIADFANTESALLIDMHAAFLDHGLNADPAEQWIDTDCTHGNNEGHHQIRRLIWSLLSGQSY